MSTSSLTVEWENYRAELAAAGVTDSVIESARAIFYQGAMAAIGIVASAACGNLSPQSSRTAASREDTVRRLQFAMMVLQNEVNGYREELARKTS